MIEDTQNLNNDFWLDYYKPTDNNIWQGRVDSNLAERYHQVVQDINLAELENTSFQEYLELSDYSDQFSFVIIGFACDEGVKRNHGRVGARKGPEALRRALANLPFNYPNTINIYDLGDIVCDYSNHNNLEEAQAALGKLVSDVLLAGCHPIVLGGGHETAWGHYQGIVTTDYADDLGIINFDAHFDLRPIDHNTAKGTSGTPFMQIALSREQEDLDFDYFCMGIQPTANTISLYQTADDLGVEYIEANELANPDNIELLDNFADFIENHDNLYLSICLDVFSSSIAKGVSAPQPLGLMPNDILPYIKLLAASDKVITLDLVELAPEYDEDGITAKLGAQLIAEYIDAACSDDSAEYSDSIDNIDNINSMDYIEKASNN